jgi:uncharacterized protein
VASLLTFFSGFGLGTMTGIVHLLNNVFKGGLVGSKASWPVVLKFGVPAIAGSFAGAKLLMSLGDTTVLYQYHLGNHKCEVTPLKLTISLLLIFFSLFEVVPALKKVRFSNNKIYAGGLLTGFFGGLSGNQGALRSAFLLRSGLSKEGFIATGIMIALLVDLTRIPVYFSRFSKTEVLRENVLLLSFAVLFAFLGAYFGNRVLKKVTYESVQGIVTVMIILLSLALAAGLL